MCGQCTHYSLVGWGKSRAEITKQLSALIPKLWASHKLPSRSLETVDHVSGNSTDTCAHTCPYFPHVILLFSLFRYQVGTFSHNITIALFVDCSTYDFVGMGNFLHWFNQ